MSSCVTLNLPLLGALLALAAPRTVAEAISRYQTLQTAGPACGGGDSNSESS